MLKLVVKPSHHVCNICDGRDLVARCPVGTCDYDVCEKCWQKTDQFHYVEGMRAIRDGVIFMGKRGVVGETEATGYSTCGCP